MAEPMNFKPASQSRPQSDASGGSPKSGSETRPPGSGSNSDTAHFDAIVIPFEPVGPVDAGPVGEGAPAGFPGGDGPAGVVLTKSQFFDAFRAMFGVPNVLAAAKGGTPIKALEIEPGDETARAASDALYDTCVDVPWLRWLIEPQNVWLQRCVVIGLFGYQRAGMVRAELASRRSNAGSAKGGTGAGDPARPDGSSTADRFQVSPGQGGAVNHVDGREL